MTRIQTDGEYYLQTLGLLMTVLRTYKKKKQRKMKEVIRVCNDFKRFKGKTNVSLLLTDDNHMAKHI